MLLLANSFASAFDVDLVLQNASGPYLQHADARIRIVDLNARRLMTAIGPLFRYLRKTRPAVTLATPYDASIVAVVAWLIAGRPGRIVVREAIAPRMDSAATHGVRFAFLRLLRRLSYPAASHIIAPSEGVAAELVSELGLGRDKVTVIANPVDVDEIERLASTSDERIDALPAGVPVILGVGRLSAQKDFATLITAFAAVRRRHVALLVLLGEGEERAKLQRLVDSLGLSADVHMPGWVPNPFVFMRRAAVFVLSSRYEGLPNALLQAMAVGAPVISTDCSSGPSDILDGGRWGTLVPVCDARALEGAIENVLKQGRTADARSIISERYAVDAIASQYLRVLLPETGRHRDASADITAAGVQ